MSSFVFFPMCLICCTCSFSCFACIHFLVSILFIYNADIVTSTDKSYFGIGILIRDDLGAWFQGKMKVCYDFNSIREAEVVDLREAICMCLDLSLQ